MKPGKTGLTRLIHATGYSWKGLKAAYTHEAAFRQEVWTAVVGIPLAFILGDTALEKLALAGSLVFLMIVELLNSALEAIVDLASPEFHELAGRAKDIASAAVMFALILTGATWIAIVFF